MPSAALVSATSAESDNPTRRSMGAMSIEGSAKDCGKAPIAMMRRRIVTQDDLLAVVRIDTWG